MLSTEKSLKKLHISEFYNIELAEDLDEILFSIAREGRPEIIYDLESCELTLNYDVYDYEVEDELLSDKKTLERVFDEYEEILNNPEKNLI